jgi:hypothetical protein
VNSDADYWADHDENCHGSYSDYEDEPEAQEGFFWTCCDNQGDHEGCMVTKHKANVNLPKKDPPPIKGPAVPPAKRLSETQLIDQRGRQQTRGRAVVKGRQVSRYHADSDSEGENEDERDDTEAELQARRLRAERHLNEAQKRLAYLNPGWRMDRSVFHL